MDTKKLKQTIEKSVDDDLKDFENENSRNEVYKQLRQLLSDILFQYKHGSTI